MDYILINGELLHYGVLGMKWGKRKAQRIEKRNAKADWIIDRAETSRSNNANTAESMRREVKTKYYTGSNKYKKEMARIDANYELTETMNKYTIAKAKAKKDKTYRQSAEFRKTKADYHKQTAQMAMYGTNGSIRINALQKRGYSEKLAKGRVFAEQALTLATIMGGAVLGAMALDRYQGR